MNTPTFAHAMDRVLARAGLPRAHYEPARREPTRGYLITQHHGNLAVTWRPSAEVLDVLDHVASHQAHAQYHRGELAVLDLMVDVCVDILSIYGWRLHRLHPADPSYEPATCVVREHPAGETPPPGSTQQEW